jgi:hypothetical protein
MASQFRGNSAKQAIARKRDLTDPLRQKSNLGVRLKAVEDCVEGKGMRLDPKKAPEITFTARSSPNIRKSRHQVSLLRYPLEVSAPSPTPLPTATYPTDGPKNGTLSPNGGIAHRPMLPVRHGLSYLNASKEAVQER